MGSLVLSPVLDYFKQQLALICVKVSLNFNVSILPSALYTV